MKGRCFHGLCCFWLRFSVILSMAYRLLDPSTPSPSASHQVDCMWRSHWSLVVIEHNSFVSWYFGFWSLSLSLEINNTHIQLIDAWNPIWKFQKFIFEWIPSICVWVCLFAKYVHVLSMIKRIHPLSTSNHTPNDISCSVWYNPADIYIINLLLRRNECLLVFTSTLAAWALSTSDFQASWENPR